MAGDFGFLGGVLMGMAGSLHCAGLCGGIASSLLLASKGVEPARHRPAFALLATQLGRVATYMAFGALVGIGGGGLDALLGLAGLQPLLRGIAATSLVWAGLAIAGIGPGFAHLDRVLAPFVRRILARLPIQALPGTSPLLFGIAWGLAPCGMVYAALVNAMLTGSPTAGATFMAGFGLATIPPVALAAWGTAVLTSLRFSSPAGARQRLRQCLGVAVAGLGLLSLAEPAMRISELCLGS